MNLHLFINPKINPMTTNKTKNSFIFACSLALTALPCAFAAQTDEHSADAMFKSMDANGDGKVSRAEHAASAQKMFADADANHDGKVTLAEMEAHHAKMNADMPMKGEMSAAEMKKMCDQNGDGQVSEAEHTAHADKMFSKMDTDSDGFLTSSECSAGHDQMMKDKKSAN